MEREKIRAQVIEDLKSYPELKKKVVLLRYELDHPAKISDGEVIEATCVGDARVAHLRKMKALGSPPEVAMTQARKTRHSVRHSSTVSFGLEPAEFARIEELCSERGVALAELARRGLRLQVYAMEAE